MRDEAVHCSPSMDHANCLTHGHMTDSPGNLVAHLLRGNDRHILADTLIGMKVERQLSIIALDDNARCLLHRLRTHAAHL